MFSIFIIAEESKTVTELRSGLIQNGFVCSITSDGNEVIGQVVKQDLDLVLVEVDGHLVNSEIRELCQRIKRERHLPIIALICLETLDSVDSHLDMDDFVLSPYNVRELILRAKRLLQRTNDIDSGELIRCGDLAIALAKCEVTLEGKLVVVAAETEYGIHICSVIARGNLIATQFHPEKSGAFGLKMYDNFIKFALTARVSGK